MIKRKFRSILVENVEKVVPGTVFTKMIIEMDESTVAEHELELSASDIATDRAWFVYLFLSLMIAGAVYALIFGLAYVGFGRGGSPETWSLFTGIFSFISIMVFLVLWIYLSVKGAIKNQKRNLVETERGKGNWRIVDESEWEEFYRLLQIAKKSREKEHEDFMNKKLSDTDMR